MAEGKKYGRDQFTKALGRIAEKVNGQQEYLIRYSNTLFGRREEESCRILVKNLWAAGSWARGALECGDLDLVLEVSALEGMLPFESNIRRAVIGGARYVRTYIGTPQKNSSGATFDEAVLIWSPKSTNWKHNINSVKPDPNAARFSRKTDELPLRPEQLQGDFPDELEKLIEMRNEGYLCWEWVEIDSIIPKPENWFEGAQAISEFASKWCGKRTQRIMPFVLQWFEDREFVVCSNTDHTNKPEFKINGAEVFVGRPSIPVYRLNDLSCSTLVLVPYITGKGPNGLWIIRRGDRHPVIESSRDLGAYVLFDGGQLRTST